MNVKGSAFGRIIMVSEHADALTAVEAIHGNVGDRRRLQLRGLDSVVGH